MATFDTYADSPHHITNEGRELVVTQHRLSPTTIQITWTIPQSMSCDLPLAYNGAIVTIDNTPTSLAKRPVDGTIYTSDSTASPSLFAGSMISTAKVVGAFYDDITTTSVTITDAPEGVPYYATVHAVDNVYRYFAAGASSYSLPDVKQVELPTSGYQLVFFANPVPAVPPQTPPTTPAVYGITAGMNTGLDATTSYTWSMDIDEKESIPFSINGADAQTFGGLVSAMNQSFIMNGNPTVSTTTPFAGSYWYNATTKMLQLYNGTSYTTAPNTIINTADPMQPSNGAYWLSGTDHNYVLNQWMGGQWNNIDFIPLKRDPRMPYCNDYWYDGTTLYKWNGGVWIAQPVIAQSLDPALPPIMSCNSYWVNGNIVYQWDEKHCKWVTVPFVTTIPAAPIGGQLMLDSVNHVLSMWDSVDATWNNTNASFSATDPSLKVTLSQGTVWLDTISMKYHHLDGSSWECIHPLLVAQKPQNIPDGSIWYNPVNKVWSLLQMGVWRPFSVQFYPTAPNVPVQGALWYNPVSGILQQYNAGAWTPTPVTTTPISQTLGSQWYNPTTNLLSSWNGSAWSMIPPIAVASITDKNELKLSSSSVGSKSKCGISNPGTLFLTSTLTPNPTHHRFVKGTDPISELPSYATLGVGTDGSDDERRKLVDVIKAVLGYPVMEVELTKFQVDTAINMALEKLRSASSAPYRRAYFPLELRPRQQTYKLTDMTVGFNKVVDVMYLYRQQSTFMGTAAGNDIYGQMMIQNLFNMGKFDLISYHMVSSYVKTMGQIFASEIQFVWDEYTRTLQIFKDFPLPEKILVDAMIERTEQDLFTDRWTRNWIQTYATAQCRYMLAGIRGKFSSVPGAGGSVSLNSSDLIAKADAEVASCMEEIDNYVVNNKNDFGLSTDFVIG